MASSCSKMRVVFSNNKRVEFSLYPYKRSMGLYILTHVKYTPLFQSESIDEANAFIEGIDDKAISDRRNLIEEDVSNACVNFMNTHEFVNHFVSLQTKFLDLGGANRSTHMFMNGNVLSLCGGKITGA